MIFCAPWLHAYGQVLNLRLCIEAQIGVEKAHVRQAGHTTDASEIAKQWLPARTGSHKMPSIDDPLSKMAGW